MFEKPSTRTRVSFEVGVAELGGTPLILRGDELQLARGESVADTARVLSRYVQAIVVRAGSHEVVAELADAAEVPVINGLTPDHHPCQALADLLTLHERFGGSGRPAGRLRRRRQQRRALAGASSAERPGIEVRVASPEGYGIEPGLAALDTDDPRQAAADADAVYTDVWVSMGDEADAAAPPGRSRPLPGERRAARVGRRSGRSSSTASRPTPARRSPRTSSTASAPRSGTRPRIASTPRRRCSSCWCGDAAAASRSSATNDS